MLLCCLLYPTWIHQAPLHGSSRVTARVAAGIVCLGLSLSSHDPYSLHTGPILPEPLSHRSLDIIVFKYVLHYCLIHANSHAGALLENSILTLPPSSSDDGEEKKRCSPVFEFSLPAPVPSKACVYSTVASVPLWCLASMLLALVGLAWTSKPGLPISRPHHHHPPQHTLPPSTPSRAHTTAST